MANLEAEIVEFSSRENTSPRCELLVAALEAAFLAADVMRMSRSDVCVLADEKSGDRGLVTEFDKEAERVIREFLLKKSGYPILGEEEGLSGLSSDRLWVVDPIDGTTNFSRKIPLSAVSIGLVERGICTLGVVYNPFLNECFFADEDFGAFLNADPIEVAPAAPRGKPVLFVNSGYALRFENCARELAERLRGKVVHRHFGTTAMEICYVACGRADGFASIGDELWDYAGAVAISRQARAKIVDWELQEWTIQRSDLLLTAPAVFDCFSSEITDIYARLAKGAE